MPMESALRSTPGVGLGCTEGPSLPARAPQASSLPPEHGGSSCTDGAAVISARERAVDDLAVKTKLLNDVLQLHHTLETRFLALEEGLAWKDAQLEELAHQHDEALRSAAAWQQRAVELETQNNMLQAAFLERSAENRYLRHRLQELDPAEPIASVDIDSVDLDELLCRNGGEWPQGI